MEVETFGRSVTTLNCLLCGGTQIYPGPRYENHLVNEHGVVFEIDYLIQLSIAKRDTGKFPASSQEGFSRKSTETSSQTDGEWWNKMCVICSESNLKHGKDKEKKKNELDEISSRDESHFLCPFCSETFKDDYKLKLHLRVVHPEEEGGRFLCELCDKELDNSSSLKESHMKNVHTLSLSEYERLLKTVKEEQEKERQTNGGFQSDSRDLRCVFGCTESFTKDYQLYLHLKYKHKSNEREGNGGGYHRGGDGEGILPSKKYSSTVNHSSFRTSRKNDFSLCDSENPFECQICSSVLPSDKASIAQHLKNAHGINWSLYLDRLRKLRGRGLDDVPPPRLQNCRICNVSVKVLKDHIKNAHKMSEGEYESLLEKAENFLAVDSQLPKPPKSDIQDKTNKTCSSCTITFASRRNFIEHCTTVHNMKFKTKSGITIQAPPSSSPIPKSPGPNKRKSDSFSVSNFIPSSSLLPPKRHRLSTPPLEDGEKTLGSHYQTTGVSRWNQCKYQCCFCKKTTQSRSSMTSHIANTHGIPIREYKERYYPDIEVVTNWFQCRLCSTKTKFVKDCISPHLRMSHSIDIEEYERQYMQPEDWPNAVKPLTGTKSEMRLEVVPKASRSLPPPEDESSSNDDEKKKWNKCRFQCKLCELITIDARQMRVHISNIHKMSYDSYVKTYGSVEIVTKKFRCEICSSEMKFCRQNIYAHMKDVHRLTLPEYEARVGILSEDEEEENGSFRWNKCRYECKLCSRNSAEKSSIVDHIYQEHGLSLEDYEVSYGDIETVTEYFYCSICHAEVKHSIKNISVHLQKVHGLSLADYEARYVPHKIKYENGRGNSRDREEEENEHDNEKGEQDRDVFPVKEEEEEEEEEEEPLEFGAHFLLQGGNESLIAQKPPPRDDVLNPKNKFCLPCNRDFNRRQAFVEHCRNVHRMKINFAREQFKETPPPTPSGPKTTPTSASLACDYCGKQFSNRSNRNRHMLLSCDVIKNAESKGQGSFYSEEMGDKSVIQLNEEEEETEHDLSSFPPSDTCSYCSDFQSDNVTSLNYHKAHCKARKFRKPPPLTEEFILPTDEALEVVAVSLDDIKDNENYTSS